MTLANDEVLQTVEDQKWDIVISFDLPTDANDYQTRLNHAETFAVIIENDDERQKLYAIETLLGKNLTREVIKGFEIVKEESKYLGKDENGKAIFSGKTRDRNHRYDGTPKSESEKREEAAKKPKKRNKSITVSSLKPKKSED
jgi:hypothetical protein